MKENLIDDSYINTLYGLNKRYIMIPKCKEYDTTFSDSKLLYYWNDTNLKKENVIALSIFDKLKIEKQIPTIIYELEGLEYLSFPTHLVKQIDWKNLCNLRAFNTTNAKLNIKEKICLPHLVHLCNYKGLVKFTPENLPKLKSLICKYSDWTMDLLLSYQKMDNIMLCNVDANICQQLSLMMTVRKLDILSGKIDSISGISQITGIEKLHLNSLSHLSNIDELIELNNLNELYINHCRNIKSWGFLLKLKCLRDLTIFDCNNKIPNQIVQELRAKGVVGIF